MNKFRPLLFVALVLISASLSWGADMYSLTVTVTSKRSNEKLTYKVNNWMYDYMQLPIFYGGKELTLSCNLDRDPTTNKIDSFEVKLENPVMLQTSINEGKSSTNPISIFSAHFPFRAGKPMTVLDGEDLLTVQIDAGKED